MAVSLRAFDGRGPCEQDVADEAPGIVRGVAAALSVGHPMVCGSLFTRCLARNVTL